MDQSTNFQGENIQYKFVYVDCNQLSFLVKDDINYDNSFLQDSFQQTFSLLFEMDAARMDID